MPKNEEVSAVNENSQPRQVSYTPEEIALHLCQYGIKTYKFFVSETLPNGKQWHFPSPGVLMISKSDYAVVLLALREQFKFLYEHEGDGFVGDCSHLLGDPTFGPMMAMAGMFHVKQESVDESAD